MKRNGISSATDIWPQRPLKRLLRRIDTGTSVNATDLPASQGEIGVLKTSCVYNGHFDPRENKTVVEEERDRVSCPVRAGSLIISRMNTPDLVGMAGCVKDEAPNLYLPDRLWQVEFAGLDERYVDYWTKTELYRSQVRAACAGTSASMQNLGQEDFLNFVIACPPRPVQAAIATYLDRETARIDALVEKKTRFIELLREKRQALITQAVTKGVDANVPTKDSGVEWLGPVPAHWNVSQLMHLTAYGRDIMYGIVLPGPDVPQGVPIVKGGDVRPHRLRVELLNRTTEEIEAPYARAGHEGQPAECCRAGHRWRHGLT